MKQTAKLYDIIDFPNYKIDLENMAVYSVLHNRQITTKYNSAALYGKKSICINLNKLIYAVQNNISPLSIVKKSIPVNDDNLVAIPGFDYYFWDKKNQKVFSNNRGIVKELRAPYGVWKLYLNRKLFYFNSNKINYAVKNNINLLEFDNNTVVTDDGELITRYDFCKKMAKSKRVRHDNIVDLYKEQCKFSEKMIYAYENNDFSNIISEIYEQKENLLKLGFKRQYFYSNEKGNELVDMACDFAVSCIIEKRLIKTSIFFLMVEKFEIYFKIKINV